MARLNLHTKRITAICGKYHVATISLFGSVARNEATKTSDIDLLVSFLRPVSLLQVVSWNASCQWLLHEKSTFSPKHVLDPTSATTS